MSVRESEEDFKLPLRQWLIKKIEMNQFDGLEWLDSEKRRFKIPWTQKGHPHWEKHYLIFKAWAQHRGNYDERNPPDDKKLKGNFRCALTKSDDFVEMKDKNRTNQQMGNYKVFMLLTPQQVNEKREKRKRPHSKSTNTTSPPSSLEMPMKKLSTANARKTHDPSQSFLDLSPNMSTAVSELAQLDSIQPIPLETSKDPRIYLQNNNTSMVHQSPCSPLAYFETKVLLSPSPDLASAYLNNGNYQQYPSPIHSHDQPSQMQIQNFQDFLEKFNIPREKLSRFKITVFYDRCQVGQTVVDLSQGVRIMYGVNHHRHKAILEAFQKNVADIDLEPWVFPIYSGDNRHIIKILQSTDLGIAIKTDANNVLRATRLCQSQVFYFDKTQAGWTSKKMERQQPTELFSYLKYIRRLIQCQRDGVGDEIDCETILVIGTKPAKPRSNTLVSVVLEPELSDLLKAHFKGNDNSLLAISQQTSLDELIRMLDGYDLTSNL